MQDTPIFDQPLPLYSFVLRQTFAAAHFPDKMKPLLRGVFKIIGEPTFFTYEQLTQDRKKFNHIF